MVPRNKLGSVSLGEHGVQVNAKGRRTNFVSGKALVVPGGDP